MMNSCIINIDGCGPVLFEHSKRARRVIIYVRPVKGIRVAVPTRTSLKKAMEFIYAKRQWIMKHVAIIEQIENQKEALANSYPAIDRDNAEQRLITRLHYLAKKHGFTYSKVTIRNQKSRWGSCSHKNNISLNMKLALLPEELIDYVILHELVHTRIHNHSKEFYVELDKYIGNSKAIGKRLRMNQLRLL